MTRISYSHLDLNVPMRIFTGRGRVQEVDAVSGVTITRTIDGILDFYVVEGGAAVPGLEIQAHAVAGGQRIKTAPVVRARGGKAKDDEDDDV